eukprot:CAMPEP_0182580308 /NCGR_PEP_ID=MMETSP1324-20130603/46596_1 /TAXON_ID=236786 /ORGANISM="Florenciella sp., Strain RCC1587" /LENGTH=43 /DNA_ID= /DNA_START= /DNA_END= /DNA_ORIENTATION=
MSLADGVEWLQAKHAQELLDAVKNDPPAPRLTRSRQRSAQRRA